MKYKCLILDHDDTAVHSTATLHYPAHLETLDKLRPGQKKISLEGWFLKNFHPGIMEYMKDELCFTEEEILIEYQIWQDYVEGKFPEFYPGFLDTVREFKENGGRVAIVSHSNKDIILRDYTRAGAEDIPEIIFGWDIDESKRKPSVYPVEEILKEFNMDRSEAIIIDDLKPAVIMGKNSGVDVAAAGWGHQIAEITDYMKKNCRYYLTDIKELRNILF